MNISSSQLKSIIHEIVLNEVDDMGRLGANVKVTQSLKRIAQDKAELALNKLAGDKNILLNLVSQGEVSIDIGDAKVVIKAGKPAVKRALEDIIDTPPDMIAKNIMTDISELDVMVRKGVGKNMQIVGKFVNPFDPESRSFNIKLTRNW